MDEVQRKGVAFALDDFGSGYTAIRYFKDFFFDILKIDSQFIRNIHRDRDNQALTKALLSIGKHFEMFTVAEGVESPEEAEFLQVAGRRLPAGLSVWRPDGQAAMGQGSAGENRLSYAAASYQLCSAIENLLLKLFPPRACCRAA